MIVLCIAFIHSNLVAQEADKSTHAISGGGYVHIGMDFIDMPSLGNSLNQYGLPEFGAQERITFGGGGGAFINRVYFGGYGEGHAGLSASNGLYKAKIYGGQGLVQVGYKLMENEFFALYPTFGAGGGGTAMRIKEGPAYAESVQGGLLQPDSRIHAGYMLLMFELNNDFYIGPNKHTAGSFLLGIAAGYQLAPWVSRWKYDNRSLPELDKYDPSGFYLRLKLGWASD